MSTKKPVRDKIPAQSTPENTKEALLEAGKQLFAKHGFDGTTVKDISEAAGVNISLVSYHFQGKEGLYRACIELYGKTHLEAAQRMLQHAESSEEFRIRLSMFIEQLMDWMYSEPEINLIIQRECDSGLPIAEDIFLETYMKVFEAMQSFIASGQKKKFIKSDLDTILMTRLIFGSVSSVMRLDQLGKRFHGTSLSDATFRKKVKDQAIKLFLDGLVDRKEK